MRPWPTNYMKTILHIKVQNSGMTCHRPYERPQLYHHSTGASRSCLSGLICMNFSFSYITDVFSCPNKVYIVYVYFNFSAILVAEEED